MPSFNNKKRFMLYAYVGLCLTALTVYQRLQSGEPAQSKMSGLENSHGVSPEQQTQRASITRLQVAYSPTALRQALVTKLIAKTSPIRVLENPERQEFIDRHLPRPLERMQILQSRVYGVATYGVLEQSGRPNDCLLIYHQGHSGSPYRHDYYYQIRAIAFSNACDILALSMLGRGFNQGPASYPVDNPTAVRQLDAKAASNHDSYSDYKDPENEALLPLALFLSGNHSIIEHVATNYKNVKIAGISGGGWQATLTAGLTTSIHSSYSFAGTVPLAFRNEAKNTGDYEQVGDPLWDEYDYWHFYWLATYDANDRQTRNHQQLFNAQDTCCFADPAASVLTSVIQGMGVAQLQAEVFKRSTHDIDPEIFQRVVFGVGQ